MPERTSQFHPLLTLSASSAESAPISWWLRAVVILGALLLATGAMLALVALVQLLDAGIDGAEGRWTLVPGVVLFGLVFFIGAVRLTCYPFWRSEPLTQ